MEALGEVLKGLFFFAVVGITVGLLAVGAAAGAALMLPFALWDHKLILLLPAALAGAGVVAIYMAVTVFGWKMPKL